MSCYKVLTKIRSQSNLDLRHIEFEINDPY